MHVQESIIRRLAAEGVDTVFTLMSEDILHLTSTMQEEWSEQFTVVETRHEQGAMAMADGYSRATDRIGVSIVGRGPAIAQTGTSLVTAANHGSKLLVIVPTPDRSAAHDHKRFSQTAFLASTGNEVVTVESPETFPDTFGDAFRRLHHGDGPIVVQIPRDVLGSETAVPADWEDATHPGVRSARTARLHPDDAGVAAIVDRYLDADARTPPILLAGRGAVRSDAEEVLERLADRTGALLATTLGAHGLFSDHPFAAGFVGTFGSNLANEFLTDADFVLAVGCSLNHHTTDGGRLLDDATVIHVDSDPGNIGREVPVDLGVNGDARVTAEKVLGELDRRDIDFGDAFRSENISRRIAETSALDDRSFEATANTVDPRALVRELDATLPDERVVVTDGGHFTNWVLDGIEISAPDDYVWANEFAAIGLGLPVGIGVAQAVDDRTCVTFCGDAGFMMSLQELDTAVRRDTSVLVVVINDEALGSEYHQLPAGSPLADATQIDTPDIAALAEGFGAEGHRVDTLADLEALDGRLSERPEGPVVVDCRVNRNVRHRFYDSLG